MLQSRKALVAKGAIMTFLAPRLAQDAKIDLDKVLADVKQKDFNERKDVIEGTLRAACRGQLAQDADLEDLGELLDMLSETKEPGEDDLSSNPNSAIPNGVGAGHEGSDGEPHDTITQIKEFLKNEGVGDDILEKLDAFSAEDESEEEKQERELWENRAKEAHDKLGRDEKDDEREEREKKQSAEDARKKLGRDEKDDEREEREARDKRARDRRMGRRARDDADWGDRRRAKDNTPNAQPDLVTKTAMDSAIDTAVKGAEKRVRQTFREIRQAEDEIRPYVGKLALDSAESAEDVYKAALVAMKVDFKDVPPAAYRAVMKAHPIPTAKTQGSGMAQDSKTKSTVRKDFVSRFPNAARVELA